MKMQHGNMKKLCRKNRCKVLSILKKTEIENARLHFWVVGVLDTHLRILVTCTDSSDKIMVQPNGLREMKGTHLLGQHLQRNMMFWLGLLLEGKNCIIFLSFFKYCNVM
jgi:hypothetical protein